MDQTPHVALLPSPGMGHLIPLVEFAKQLIHHHLSVIVIVPSAGLPTKAEVAVLQTLQKNTKHIFLPPVDLPNNLDPVSQIFLTMSLSLPSLRDILVSLTATTRLAALVVDPFGIDTFDIAEEIGVPKYLFFPSNATALLLSLHMPKLDEMVIGGEYRDLPEPIKLPGCLPINGKDLPDGFHDRSDEAYKRLLKVLNRFNSGEGIILNSFIDVEEGAIKALQVKEIGKPPIYPIGPLIRSSNGLEQPEYCLRWLDDQPSGSVIYVSFGSGGTLSQDQLNELALGLEISGQKFLWVVRSPNSNSAVVSFFDDKSQNDPFSFLPKGFLDRTKEQGLVVPSWAPQIEILSHGSTGVFLTHCGWNSILESIVHGVPLIAWPLYSEQKMNAVMLTEGLNVALRPRCDENGLVGKEEIVKVVKDLMVEEEGKKVRQKMKYLKDAAKVVLSEDGSSSKSLSELVLKWKNHKNN